MSKKTIINNKIYIIILNLICIVINIFNVTNGVINNIIWQAWLGAICLIVIIPITVISLVDYLKEK